MSTEFNVMLAKSYSPERVKNWSGIHVEPKLDGIRVVCTLLVRDSPIYYSRNGRALEMLSHLNSELMTLSARLLKLNKGYGSGTFLDGELISATGNFEDISGVIHRKEPTTECLDARLHLFHAMPLELFKSGADRMPQLYRNGCLEEALSYGSYRLLSHSAPIKADCDKVVQRYYNRHRDAGYEGTMVKDLNVPWTGKRSYAWMKMKAEETADVKVIDLKEGKGKYAGTTGALICLHKKKRINVSGMKDAQRNEFWSEPENIKGRMIEVTYQNETNHGALRHPRFKRLRPDKERV